MIAGGASVLPAASPRPDAAQNRSGSAAPVRTSTLVRDEQSQKNGSGLKVESPLAARVVLKPVDPHPQHSSIGSDDSEDTLSPEQQTLKKKAAFIENLNRLGTRFNPQEDASFTPEQKKEFSHQLTAMEDLYPDDELQNSGIEKRVQREYQTLREKLNRKGIVSTPRPSRTVTFESPLATPRPAFPVRTPAFAPSVLHDAWRIDLQGSIADAFKKRRSTMHKLEQEYLYYRGFLAMDNVNSMMQALGGSLFAASHADPRGIVHALSVSQRMTRLLELVHQKFSTLGKHFKSLLDLAQKKGWEERTKLSQLFSNEFPVYDAQYRPALEPQRQQQSMQSVGHGVPLAIGQPIK